jgi:DNA-binding transcriptional LysR family regulator
VTAVPATPVRGELFRALGAVAGDPADARAACAALGLPVPGNAEHTEVFVLNCPPYASVYLGAEGGLGGEAADRVAGFWRAIGVPPPAEPDHLTALLSLYARLGEAPVAGNGAAGPLAPATAGALARARQALFWEHRWPWLPVYLDAVDDLRTPALASWARLVRRALAAERGRHPGGRLPLALRAAPVPSSPVIEPGGPGDLLDMLTASVRSGFVLTRRGLSVAADAAGAGHRIGERRFTLRAMLDQAPAETTRWLSAEAARWSARHQSRGPAGDIVQAWWAGRAARTARLLAAGQAVRLQMPLVAGSYSRKVPLSDRVPDLAALEMLLAVAHTGSLNAASRQLGITQQAVSARVRSAEAQVGVALIARTPRGSSLTPEGVVVAEWAARLLAVAGELDAGLAAFRTDHQTRLRVSASLTIAEQLLPGWLVSLQAGARRSGRPAPQIVLTAANSDTVTRQVRQGQADLGFVEGPAGPKGLRSRVIGHDELVVIVRPDHPWARRRQPLEPAELAAASIVSREEGSGTRGVLTAALSAALGTRVTVPVALALSTTAAVRSAVLAGAGPAVLSELTVAEDISARRLARIPVARVNLRRSLRSIWTGGTLPPVGAARDLLAHVTSGR